MIHEIPCAQPAPTCPHSGKCHPGFCPCTDVGRLAEPATERQAFEHAERASDLTRDEDCPEDYRNQCVQSAWDGWKARAAYGLKNAHAEQAHAEAYYRQAERLLTANEQTLHAECERLRDNLKSVWAKTEAAAERHGFKLVMQMPQQHVELIAIPAPEGGQLARALERLANYCEKRGFATETVSSAYLAEARAALAAQPQAALHAAARKVLEARERYGWSPEADAAIYALADALKAAPEPQVAPGMVLVPAEPTDDMLNAGKKVQHDGYNKSPRERSGRVYRAMLAAAPQTKEPTNDR